MGCEEAGLGWTTALTARRVLLAEKVVGEVGQRPEGNLLRPPVEDARRVGLLEDHLGEVGQEGLAHLPHRGGTGVGGGASRPASSRRHIGGGRARGAGCGWGRTTASESLSSLGAALGSLRRSIGNASLLPSRNEEAPFCCSCLVAICERTCDRSFVLRSSWFLIATASVLIEAISSCIVCSMTRVSGSSPSRGADDSSSSTCSGSDDSSSSTCSGSDDSSAPVCSCCRSCSSTAGSCVGWSSSSSSSSADALLAAAFSARSTRF